MEDDVVDRFHHFRIRPHRFRLLGLLDTIQLLLQRYHLVLHQLYLFLPYFYFPRELLLELLFFSVLLAYLVFEKLVVFVNQFSHRLVETVPVFRLRASACSLPSGA